MKSWTSSLAICVILVVGCQRSIAVSNPDGDTASLGEFWLAPLLVVRWAAPLAYLALASAAFVAWRYYRKSALLLLCLAATSVLVGTVGNAAANAPMRGATIDEMRSGAALPIAWLLNLANSLTAVGYVLAVIGGLVALLGVLRNRSIGQEAEQFRAPERAS